jgi:phosphoglycolate phosphatase
VTSLLVLWDVDQTLLNPARTGAIAYRLALRELWDLEMPAVSVPMAGRTDSAIAVDVLTAAGIADPRGQLARFQEVQARYAGDVRDAVRARGRALPGAAEAVAALAARSDGRRIIQSALTGNLRALAEAKLSAVGLTAHLDLDAGAYGDVSENRADLVPAAQRGASARYGGDFSGAATVLVGDTPLDVAAALAHGARAVAVATGSFSEADLRAAGAHAVLPDLTDLGRVLAAILAEAGEETTAEAGAAS